MKYAFIADHQHCWPVAVRCEVLGVGRSGFYDYQRRQAAPALSREEIALLERIKAISEKTAHNYGSRRMVKQLQDEGYEVGRFTVHRLMPQAGVSVEDRRRRGPKTTESRHGYGAAPNLLERSCDVTAPNVAGFGVAASCLVNGGVKRLVRECRRRASVRGRLWTVQGRIV